MAKKFNRHSNNGMMSYTLTLRITVEEMGVKTPVELSSSFSCPASKYREVLRAAREDLLETARLIYKGAKIVAEEATWWIDTISSVCRKAQMEKTFVCRTTNEKAVERYRSTRNKERELQKVDKEFAPVD